jgi:oligosaccharide repeat unit polymerase
MRSVLPSLVLLTIFMVALIRLPPLHPIQIWSASWTLALMLYALRLIPYRNLSWLTVVLICGGTLSFALGTLAGEGIGRRIFSRDMRPPPQTLAPTAVRLAARASLLIGAVLLAVFLGQLTLRYGLVSTLRVSRPVRLALVSGAAPKSFLYARFAIVAAGLCSLAAVLAVDRASRRRWLLACACAISSLYFSTGRQLIVNALIVAVVVFVLASGRSIVRGRLISVTSRLALLTLVIFVGVGAVIGNTYQTNAESKFNNVFSRHAAISWLAPAYAHASAPIPALDIAVKVSSTWGRAYGCATAAFECRMLRHVGLNVDEEPPAPPFTQAPLPWNAYTFLGTLLNDGGTALLLVLVALCGSLIGVLWSLHRSGNAYGTILYAFSVPALVWAYRQNLLDAEAGAAFLAIGLVWATTRAYRSSRLLRLLAAPKCGRSRRARDHAELRTDSPLSSKPLAKDG